MATETQTMVHVFHSKTIVLLVAFGFIVTEQFNAHNILGSFTEHAHNM